MIEAHSYFGDFEVYKYGLDTDQIQDGNRFRLTQSQFRPYKNYYNDQDIRSEEKNEYYISIDMNLLCISQERRLL